MKTFFILHPSAFILGGTPTTHTITRPTGVDPLPQETELQLSLETPPLRQL